MSVNKDVTNGSAENFRETFRVGVRIPPFYPEKPALWFAQLEAQFTLSNITTDATKYFYAVGNLDPQYASEVEDIIEAPPSTEKYEKLKTELIKRLSASRERKVKQLLMHEELGDRKPSQFYRHLHKLAGPGVPDEFLRTIWTSRLPSGTQSIIASQPKAAMEELAELADRIHDVVCPQVASASTTSNVPGSSGQMSGEVSLIAALTKQVEALATKVERLSRGRIRKGNHHNNRNRNQSRERSQSNYRKWPVCYFHWKYGDQARKCITPCDYKQSGNGKGSQ